MVGGGEIKVTYTGSQANAKLSAVGKNVLSFVPGLDQNADVVWICGTASTPTGVTLGDGTTAGNPADTVVTAAYLPNSCHS